MISLEKIKLRPNGREARKARFRKQLFFEFSHSFILTGLRQVCFPRYFANILQSAASRTLWKQPPMSVLNSSRNNLRKISSETLLLEVYLDLFLNELQLSYYRYIALESLPYKIMPTHL